MAVVEAPELTQNWDYSDTLTEDQWWQARHGSVMVSTEANPGPKDGLLLDDGEPILFTAGTTVHAKRLSPDAYIVRETV